MQAFEADADERDRMKTKIILSALACMGLVCLYWLATRDSAGRVGQGHASAKLSHRASVKTDKSRVVYPYSLVPGGVRSPEELRSRPDSYARKFYGNLDYRTATMWRSYGGDYYNSYRVGNRIYQKTVRSHIRAGELLLKVDRHTGEPVFIKARCGNLLLDRISVPTELESLQPSDEMLGDAPENPTPRDPRLLVLLPKSPQPPDLAHIQAIAGPGAVPGELVSLDQPAGAIAPDGRLQDISSGPVAGGDFYPAVNSGGGGGGSDYATPAAKQGAPPPAVPPNTTAVAPEPAAYLYLLAAGLFLMGLRRVRKHSGSKGL